MTDNILLPICIDLDGTLIKDDVTQKSFWIYLRRRWFNLAYAIYWFCSGGMARMKKNIAKQVMINPDTLEYNLEFLAFIKKKRADGHKLFLATGSDELYARAVSEHLKIFDGVFASNGVVNLKAQAKADCLSSEFGKQGFTYAGNSLDDIPVWKKACEVIIVSPSSNVMNKMRSVDHILFK